MQRFARAYPYLHIGNLVSYLGFTLMLRDSPVGLAVAFVGFIPQVLWARWRRATPAMELEGRVLRSHELFWRRPFEIRIAEGSSWRFNQATKTLRVSLPDGTRDEVRFGHVEPRERDDLVAALSALAPGEVVS